MTPARPPHGSLRAAGLVRAIPALWCAALGALVGHEVFHRAVATGLPERACLTHGVATAAFCVVNSSLVLYVATRDLSRFARATGCIVAFGAGLLVLWLSHQVAFSLFTRFDATASRVHERWVLDANMEAMRFLGANAMALFFVLPLELPLIGTMRRLRRRVSAEELDEALLLFGLGTVAHAVAFRAIGPRSPQVSLALVTCAAIGLGLASYAELRRRARRRWLANVAAERDSAWRLRIADADVALSPGLELLVDDGARRLMVHARCAARDAYRSMTDGSAPPVAWLRTTIVEPSTAPSIPAVGRVAPLRSLLLRATQAAIQSEVWRPGATNARMKGLADVGFGCLGAIAMVLGFLAWGVRRVGPKHGSEATRSLGLLETGLRAYAAKHHRFPRSGGPVPATLPRGEFSVPASAWASPPWSDVGFSIVEPHHYQFEIETTPDGQRCWARARGDLDGDGVTSLFEVEERIGATGELERAHVRIEREDE
ncbi:MAG: hypothetical protein HYV09_00690 [Deltaproteobacteria bacterium]|nr:hypothetical protein [Deltaproteobacteria bacterium]